MAKNIAHISDVEFKKEDLDNIETKPMKIKMKMGGVQLEGFVEIEEGNQVKTIRPND